ncbi:Transcriptional regulator, AraC family [Polaromonas sp. CG9_12]|nr:Transcriptional regulator, AraC family [Polaromonas sp. CG9_12]
MLVNAHSEGSRYAIIDMAQRFLRPGLDVDPLDLEEVLLSTAPELAPFLFQEYLDFCFPGDGFAPIEALLEPLERENSQRRFGSSQIMRCLLLQLIGMNSRRFEADLLRLSASHAQQSSRHARPQHAVRYICDHLWSVRSAWPTCPPQQSCRRTTWPTC